MNRPVPGLATDFFAELQAGHALCVMPLPRVELGLEPISVLKQFRIYPRGDIELTDLNVVSFPMQELEKFEHRKNELMRMGARVVTIGRPDLAWYQSGLTRIDIKDFERFALIAFPIELKPSSLFEASHETHKNIIRAASEQAERALDIIRFEECRLDIPDSLPGRAGTFDLSSPYSAALFYFLEDNESYVIAGQCVTHLVASGIGLQLEISPAIERIGIGETGYLARQALGMFTQALESNSESDKFTKAMSTLEFIAGGGEYLQMKNVKTMIAAHIAKTRIEYHQVCDRFRDLTSNRDSTSGEERGIRTRIVHMGQRLEEIVPSSSERCSLFQELQRYIGKSIEDMIDLSDSQWNAVIDFRSQRMKILGV